MEGEAVSELDPGFAKGYLPRDYAAFPRGCFSFATQFDLPLIPRAEWADRIADMERTKSRLSDIAAQSGVPVLNQAQIGYCHAFSPCWAVMAQRAAQRLPFELLSASSIGGPVTGFRNAGAYIFDDMKQITEYGVTAEKLYPMLTTQNHWNAEAQADAKRHRVTEWIEGQNRAFDQVMTCLLSRIPVCVGLNWWGHAVTYADPVYQAGQFGIRGPNSWGTGWSYHDDPGWFTFFEGYGQYKATPDEWYAPRQVTGA